MKRTVGLLMARSILRFQQRAYMRTIRIVLPIYASDALSKTLEKYYRSVLSFLLMNVIAVVH
jgi:hypothetical protein